MYYRRWGWGRRWGGEKFAQYTVITVPNTLDGRGITELFLTSKCVVWELEPDTEYELFQYAQVKAVKTALLLEVKY
jgi:hypothetical protein